MNQDEVDKASDRAFQEDRNLYLNLQAERERRWERIVWVAEDAMRPGEKFYPLEFSNFKEALENHPEQTALWRSLVHAARASGADTALNGLFVTYARSIAFDYWRKIALIEAEKITL